MSFNVRTVIAILLLIVFAGMPPIGALAGGSVGGPANRCPAGTVCDHALGIAVTPPANWRLLPAGKLPPHTIGLHALPLPVTAYLRHGPIWCDASIAFTRVSPFGDAGALALVYR
jgi:hypothetical protein